MPARWQFTVLGPIEVVHAGRVIPITACKQRVILAALLIHANRVVPVSDLVAYLWDDSPPRADRNSLQNHLMRLRRTLGTDALIHTRPNGYLIRVDRDSVDVHRFHSLVTTAKTAIQNREFRSVSRLLGAALDLWQGPALVDTPSSCLQREVVPSWAETRLRAVELRIDAELTLGRHHDLIAELTDLTARHPFRESFWGRRIIALYRARRQAEALTCYHVVKDLLSNDLGVDPGTELKSLYHKILTADPALMTVM
jgi:DNA-binding SARP family transcriptional activator